jgi:hypothetical protein
MMTAIEHMAPSKDSGSVRPLDGVNLTVETGEIFGFLGPNGAETQSGSSQDGLRWFLGDGSAATATLRTSLDGKIRFYLTGWLSLVALAAWLVVPLTMGYRRCNGANLRSNDRVLL